LRSNLLVTVTRLATITLSSAISLGIFSENVSSQAPSSPPDIAKQVEIRRTTYGIPHIKAQNLAAANYGLAYVMLEDYGGRVAMGLLRGRGEMGKWFGRDSMESDFGAQHDYKLAVENYSKLEQATRDVYEGFAAGVNRYIELHPTEFPEGFRPMFTGYDVAARDVTSASAAAARRFLSKVAPQPTTRRGAQPAADPSDEGTPGVDPIEEGSNAWAFAPSRTKSGKANLLRNPHLQWNSGYYEGHMTVPGVLDFYGDFRIGGPFGVIGGFNKDLGWSTTNNAPDLDEIYALDVDPGKADRYLLDGTSLPLERELTTVTYKNGAGYSTETRESWRTPLGPVIWRDGGKIYVLRAAAEGDFRGGEQFLHMMRAKSLAEWKEAMRIRSRVNSSFTYADRAGNILYVWNASIPSLPHPSGGDTAAVPASRTSQVWTRYVDWDSLPQLLNPKGGYVHNENDPPYHTNLHQILDRAKYPANFPEPLLRLRSQMALTLIDNNRKLSLEDVIALKHSYRMLLADRVKDDLIAAVRATNPDAATSSALDQLAKWDNTAGPDSKGAVLFQQWWAYYTQGENPDSMYAEAWSVDKPATTPRGLKDRPRAAAAFTRALAETTRLYKDAFIAWGEVHRVRMGNVDVPVGGCSGALGCFRVLNFANTPDGKRRAIGGDGWILAIEFGNIPRAYSVLAYGESSKEDSPNHSDQAAMFAKGEMKRVAFTPADIEASTVKKYNPGLQP
jgi:acyl-homoserine-lactone acylase